MTHEEKLKWQLEVTGIQKYHDAGYKGKGITVLNHESTEHGGKALSIIKMIAPEATFIEANVTQVSNSKQLLKYDWKINGDTYTFEEMMKEYRPDIISVSLAGTECTERDDLLRPYIERGDVVICNSTGNDGVKIEDDKKSGIRGMYKNIALMIGACYFHNSKDNIKIMPYSGRDKETPNVDFVGFTWDWGGTSAACPFVAGQLALFMSRFGKMSQAQIKESLKPYCKDLGDKGEDWVFGNGLIVLPDDVRKEKDVFKDVDNNRWSIEDIEWAVENGIVSGYEDGTFRPEQTVTREQCVAMLRRTYNLMKGEKS